MPITKEADFSFTDGVSLPPLTQDSLDRMGDVQWMPNNSHLNSYGDVYSKNGYDLTQVLEELVDKQPDNVGLDIAGGRNGVAIRELIDLGLISCGAVTNYEDTRDEEARAVAELAHIDGDIVRPETWRKIFDWQRSVAANGLAIVLHRPHGPLQNLPYHFYLGATNAVLDWIRPGGVFCTQIPSVVLCGEGRKNICSALSDRGDNTVVDLISSRSTGRDDFAIIRKD